MSLITDPHAAFDADQLAEYLRVQSEQLSGIEQMGHGMAKTFGLGPEMLDVLGLSPGGEMDDLKSLYEVMLEQGKTAPEDYPEETPLEKPVTPTLLAQHLKAISGLSWLELDTFFHLPVAGYRHICAGVDPETFGFGNSTTSDISFLVNVCRLLKRNNIADPATLLRQTPPRKRSTVLGIVAESARVSWRTDAPSKLQQYLTALSVRPRHGWYIASPQNSISEYEHTAQTHEPWFPR